MATSSKSNIVVKRLANQKLMIDLCAHLNADERVNKVGIILESIGRQGILSDPFREYMNELDRDDFDFVLYVPNIISDGTHNNPDWNALNRYENEFGDPWLRSYLSAARKTYYDQFTYEEKASIIVELFDQYIETFEEFQPDLFLCDDMGSLTSTIPFHIIKHRYNGEAIWWHSTRIGDQYGVSESEMDCFPEIFDSYYKRDKANLNDEYTEQATEYIRNYRTGSYSRYGDRVRDNGHGRKQYGLIDGALRYLYLYNCKNYHNDFKMIPTYKFTRNYLADSIKRKYLYWSGIFDTPDINADYVFFPLHYQPEWTTLVLSPLFSDEINQFDVIHKLQKCIPLNHQLYVKAHPTQMRKSPRSINFFKNISQLDSVKLIDPRADPHEYIKNAEVVVTITGTSGLQGMLYKRPVITLGNPSYSIMNSVTQANVEELDTVIKYSIEDHNHDEQDLINYISAVFEKGFPYNRDAKTPSHPEYEQNLNNILSAVFSRLT